MAEYDEKIAALERRIDALEAELKDKRATDAHLYFMISASSEALLGVMKRSQALLTGAPDPLSAEDIKAQIAKFDRSSKEVEDLIWGAKDAGDS